MFIKYLAKFHDTTNAPLPVLLGNEQDLCHKNTVNTYLFYQVCKVYDIACFGAEFPNAEKWWHLSFRHFWPKPVPQLNFIKNLAKIRQWFDNDAAIIRSV